MVSVRGFTLSQGGNGWIPAYSITCDLPLSSLRIAQPKAGAQRAPTLRPSVGPTIEFESPGTRNASTVPCSGVLSWSTEPDMDRRGGDYRDFDIAEPILVSVNRNVRTKVSVGRMHTLSRGCRSRWLIAG